MVQSLPGSIVVINQELQTYASQLEELGLQVIINAHTERGIGSSIACGIRASEDASSWLIALADMPYIKIDTLTQLVDRLEQGSDIVAPIFDGQRGHPVGFSQRYKKELVELDDDVGARHIIEQHQTQLELITTDDAGVIRDIDQIDDIPELI